MVDELDFLDEEDEQGEDAFEDEFDDEFDDEFGAGYDDDLDDDYAFGPVYVQGDISRGFEGVAIVASFAVIVVSLFLLWTQVGQAVYDNPLAESAHATVDGLGQGAGAPVAFAPSSVRVVGLGRYDTSQDDFDYAVLGAGARHGLSVGMLLRLGDATLAVVKVEELSARADFVTVDASSGAQISKDGLGMIGTDYVSLANLPLTGSRTEDIQRAGEAISAEALEGAVRDMPRREPVSLPLHRALVYEASDGQGRYAPWAYLNEQVNMVSAARFSAGSVAQLDSSAQRDATMHENVPRFGYVYFSRNVRARVLPAAEQALLKPIVDAQRQSP